MRPRKHRKLGCYPGVRMFKPRGIPASELEWERLAADEWEGLRLVDLEGKHLEEAGAAMGVSRATMGRILNRARRKVAGALVHGRAIVVEEDGGGGPVYRRLSGTDEA